MWRRLYLRGLLKAKLCSLMKREVFKLSNATKLCPWVFYNLFLKCIYSSFSYKKLRYTSIFNIFNDNYLNEIKILKASFGAGTKSVTVYATGSIPTRGKEIFLEIYSSVSSLWRGKEHRWVPPLNSQCLQNSAERSVLTLGPLCLPHCVLNTAWSWFDLFYFLN